MATQTATATTTPMPEQAITKGVTPHLWLRDASAAADFYKRAFGAEEVVRVPGADGKIMHCHLSINGGPLFLMDAPCEAFREQRPQGFLLNLEVDDADAWFRRAVEAGAEVALPLAVQPWGARYGQVRDAQGVTWGIGGPGK